MQNLLLSVRTNLIIITCFPKLLVEIWPKAVTKWAKDFETYNFSHIHELRFYLAEISLNFWGELTLNNVQNSYFKNTTFFRFIRTPARLVDGFQNFL